MSRRRVFNCINYCSNSSNAAKIAGQAFVDYLDSGELGKPSIDQRLKKSFYSMSLKSLHFTEHVNCKQRWQWLDSVHKVDTQYKR